MVTKSVSKVYVILCDYISDGNIISGRRYVSSYLTLQAALWACEKLNLAVSSVECKYYIEVDYVL